MYLFLAALLLSRVALQSGSGKMLTKVKPQISLGFYFAAPPRLELGHKALQASALPTELKSHAHRSVPHNYTANRLTGKHAGNAVVQIPQKRQTERQDE